MTVKQQVYCDLCGDEVEPSDDNFREEYQLSLGKLGGEAKYDIYKDLCEDCAGEVHDAIMGLDWAKVPETADE